MLPISEDPFDPFDPFSPFDPFGYTSYLRIDQQSPFSPTKYLEEGLNGVNRQP